MIVTNGAILLVEDNPNDEILTLRAFRKTNITNEVIIARDGEEALDYLFGTGAYEGRDVLDLPQLVILDLKLPKINGLEVLRQIRSDERTKTVPVIIMTSSKEEQDVVKAYSLGSNAYVQKPVDFVEFAEAVKCLGMFWLLLNQPFPSEHAPI